MDDHNKASEAGSRSLPHLPEDLWRCIAALLPPKDWARLSGTCAALHKITLDRIQFQGTHSSTSELLWLSSRLHGASAADLLIKSVCGTELKVTQRALRTQVPEDEHQMALSFLQRPPQLQLWELGQHEDILRIMQLLMQLPPRHEREPLAQQLLAKAGHVHLMYMCLRGFPVFPPLANLKHLVVITQLEGNKYAGQASLRHLRCLETLKIGNDDLEWISDGDLLAPASLKHLSFDGAIIYDVKVPKGCSIAVRASLFLIEHGVHERVLSRSQNGPVVEAVPLYRSQWSAVTEAAVRSLTFKLTNSHDGSFREHETLRYWQGIENLAIQGQKYDVLLGSLSKLGKLRAVHVTGANLEVTIPARLHLVHFDVSECLSISFEDPVVSARNLRCLQWTYREFHISQDSIEQVELFERGLAERGMSLSFEQKDTSEGVMTVRAVSEMGELSCWDEVCGCRCCSRSLKLPDEQAFQYLKASCASPLDA